MASTSVRLSLGWKNGEVTRKCFVWHTGLQLVGLQPHASAMSGNDVAHAEFVA